MKARYNSSFCGPHFTCALSYYYVYFRLSAPYSCIFTSLSFYLFIIKDLSFNYIYKSYRNLKYSKTLYDSLVHLVENVLLYTKSLYRTILAEFLILFADHCLCDCHQCRTRLQRTKE
jgi:hypothetical protein